MLALLRRVTEARRGGVSRESQLRHLAAWFTAAGSADAAHALFDAVFGLGAPRHVGSRYDDPEAIPAAAVLVGRRPRWSCPAPWSVRARPGQGNGARPGWTRSERGAARLRERAARRGAPSGRRGRPSWRGLGRAVRRPCSTTAQLAVLLRLLDLALPARPGRAAAGPAAVSGVRLDARPAHGLTTVPTEGGQLHLDGYAPSTSRSGRPTADEPLCARDDRRDSRARPTTSGPSGSCCGIR